MALSLAVPPAQAQQLAFSQRTVGSEVAFSYRFRDIERRERTLDFRLPASEVEAAMRAFRDYSLGGLNQHIEAAIADASRRAGVAVNFTVAADGRRTADFNGSADRIERLQRSLPAVLEAARADYLGRYWRRHEGDAIYVDYPAAVRQAMQTLAPLAAVLARESAGGSERAIVQHALGFLQTIPYDDLTNVSRLGGIDFAPADAMLKLNAGDCDSKAVAMAALLRLLLPQRATIIIRTRPADLRIEHALALVDIPAQPGDSVLRFGGRIFVALEASGPDPAAVGTVDERIGDRLARGEVIAVEVGR